MRFMSGSSAATITGGRLAQAAQRLYEKGKGSNSCYSPTRIALQAARPEPYSSACGVDAPTWDKQNMSPVRKKIQERGRGRKGGEDGHAKPSRRAGAIFLSSHLGWLPARRVRTRNGRGWGWTACCRRGRLHGSQKWSSPRWVAPRPGRVSMASAPAPAVAHERCCGGAAPAYLRGCPEYLRPTQAVVPAFCRRRCWCCCR